MAFEKVILARIEAGQASGVPVAWAIAPRNSSLPRVVCWTITGTFDLSIDAPSGLRTATVQVDCWGSSYNEVRVIADAVLASLHGWTDIAQKIHGVFLEGTRDGDLETDIDDRVFRISQDFAGVFFV